MTKNTNPASNTQYQLVLEKFPDLKLMAQTVDFPSATMPPVEVFPQDGDYTIPSDRVLYEPLSVTFLVDDNYDNYYELYEWLLYLKSVDDGHKYATTGVLILYNRQYQPVKRVTFKEVIISGLSGFTLTSNEDDTILSCTATFEYVNFEMEKI